MRIASKVENLHTKCEHARPLGSRIVRYVRDGRTDRQTDRQTNRQTDKSNAYCFLPYGRKHNYSNDVNQSLCMRIYYSLAKGRYR